MASAVLKGVKCKSAQELSKKTKEALDGLTESKKSMEGVAVYLTAMKAVLYGSGDSEPQQEVIAHMSQEIYSTHLLLAFITNLERLDFECKKDVVQIFNKVLRREIGERKPTVEYITTKPEILQALVMGYEKPDIALHCGQMLRDCIKFDPLAKIVLNDENLFYKFFGYVQQQQFDIAADAFATFKDLLTNHKISCAAFLEKNYDRVFENYVSLLGSNNYVTRRQSLKLLGELLLDRANFMIMTKYISEPENLKLMMNMLRDKSKNITFEAFHVFKVFVANPNKSQPIMDILLKNRDKLVGFLKTFHESREDEQFADEKAYLIKQIQELK